MPSILLNIGTQQYKDIFTKTVSSGQGHSHVGAPAHTEVGKERYIDT